MMIKTFSFGSWWAANVAAYCPGRMAEHLKSKSTEGFSHPDWSLSIFLDRYDTPDSTSIIQPRDRKIKIAEDRALCTSEYSDMTPLTGANVAFSTLEGRPSAYNFEYSPGELRLKLSGDSN